MLSEYSKWQIRFQYLELQRTEETVSLPGLLGSAAPVCAAFGLLPGVDVSDETT